MSQEEFVNSMVGVWGLSKEESEIAIKKARVNDLWMKAINFPPMLRQFFDLDSDKLLDKKIEVLTALQEGKTISNIPNLYDILELYPKKQEMNGIITDVYWD